MRYLAVVDDEKGTLFIDDGQGTVAEYHLEMYSAAISNPKYWEDAHLRTVNKSIQELLENQ